MVEKWSQICTTAHRGLKHTVLMASVSTIHLMPQKIEFSSVSNRHEGTSLPVTPTSFFGKHVKWVEELLINSRVRSLTPGSS